MEERTLGLDEILRPRDHERVGTGLTRRSGPESDKVDAYGLAEGHRAGPLEQTALKAPSEYGLLRELARLESVYRSRGASMTGRRCTGRGSAPSPSKMWKYEEPYHPTNRPEKSPRAHGASG